MRYAMIAMGHVVNVVEAEAGYEVPGMLAVPSNTANIGDAYENGVFSPGTREVSLVIGKDEFLQMVGIQRLTVLCETRKTDSTVDAWMLLLDSVSRLNLQSDYVSMGLTAMVSAGVISEGDKQKLLNGEYLPALSGGQNE